MVRKKDIIRLCEDHPDCVFSAFTNGTLIDEAFAEEMLRVKNFVPAISIEGFEEATDSRRGGGTYRKIIRAMNILKERKLPFGISCCYTSANAEVIGSEAYFDQMIEMGAKFAWFFTYMPVGKAAVPELMATAEQREMMYHKIREYRQTKPLFTIDFWNDGEYVGAASPEDVLTAILMLTGTWNPVHLSIIRIPTSVRNPCWKHAALLCSWDIMTISPGMTICCAPVQYWTIRGD